MSDAAWPVAPAQVVETAVQYFISGGDRVNVAGLVPPASYDLSCCSSPFTGFLQVAVLYCRSTHLRAPQNATTSSHTRELRVRGQP